MSMGQRKSLSPWQDLNLWPPKHWAGALSTWAMENYLMESKAIYTQCCQLSRIMRETADFEPFLPVSRFESEISWIIAEVYNFL